MDNLAGIPCANGGQALPFYALVMGFLLLRIAWRLIREYFHSTDEMRKRRVEFILLGEIFYVLCALHDVFLRLEIFWIFGFPIVEYATLAFMIIVAYATLRYQLIDVGQIIGLGLFYTLLTVFTAVTYTSIQSLLENQLQQVVASSSIWVQLLPALVVTLFFELIRDLLQRLIEKWILEPQIRFMKIFRSPNFHALVLNNEKEKLIQLRNEINNLIEST